MPGTDRDRADVHVTGKDMPAFLSGFWRSAAGEGGHAPSSRDEVGV